MVFCLVRKRNSWKERLCVSSTQGFISYADENNTLILMVTKINKYLILFFCTEALYFANMQESVCPDVAGSPYSCGHDLDAHRTELRWLPVINNIFLFVFWTGVVCLPLEHWPICCFLFVTIENKLRDHISLKMP